jgi:hypothetical protein
LNLANAFGQALQDGRVIDVKEQLKALPLAKRATGAGSVPAEVVKDAAPSDNGKDGNVKNETASTKGPAIP